MIQFQKKALQRSKTLGERLKKVREDSGITLEEAAKKTQIQKKYLQAIEEGDYAALPGAVYIEGFLKKYAEFLEVSSDFVLSLYHHHDKKTLKKRYRQSFTVKSQDRVKVRVTPRMIKLFLIILVIGACLTYVGFEVAKIFSPPRLEISGPADYIIVNQSVIEVKGATQPEASLYINDQQVFLSDQGNFSEQVNLKEGINEITISAIKEKSKPRTIVRHISYKPSQ